MPSAHLAFPDRALVVDAHAGPNVPYISIYPAGYTGESIVVHLGNTYDNDERAVALVQISRFRAALDRAELLLAVTEPIKAGPDDPDDEPTDEPVIAECVYCGARAPHEDAAPADDERGWEIRAREHAASCEWVQTRAHALVEIAHSGKLPDIGDR